MNENKTLENASELNNGTSDDTKPKPHAESSNLANVARKTYGLDENADGQSLDENADIDASKIGETTKRGPGAPRGNLNNFRHGFYSRQLQKAKKGKLKGSARRKAAATCEAVLADQGGPDNCSVTLQFVIQRFSRRVARLSQMEKAVNHIIKKNPLVLQVPNALGKLYSFLRPIEQDAIDDAKTIGFRMANGSSSIADQIRAIEQQPNDESQSD